jgi:hypothetical protein
MPGIVDVCVSPARDGVDDRSCRCRRAVARTAGARYCRLEERDMDYLEIPVRGSARPSHREVMAPSIFYGTEQYLTLP